MRFVRFIALALSMELLVLASGNAQNRSLDLSRATIDDSQLHSKGILIIDSVYFRNRVAGEITIDLTESKVVDTLKSARYAVFTRGVPSILDDGRYRFTLYVRDPKLPLSRKTGYEIVFELNATFNDSSVQRGRKVFKN